MGTLGFSITSPLLPDLADALGVNPGAIGLVQAAVSIPGVLLSALIGWTADRVGRRRVVLTSLILFATAGSAGFVARSYWLLVGARIVQGIGTSGILGLSIVVVGDLFTGAARTKAMGINLTGLTVVNMAGPVMSGFIGEADPFRPFLIFLIGFPLAIWATRMPVEPRRGVTSPLAHASEAIAVMRRNRQLVDFVGVLGITMATTVLLHGFGFTTTPLYLDSVFGISADGRGLIIASFQVGTALAALQIGRLRSRQPGSRLVEWALILMGVGAAVTAVAPYWWFVSIGLGISGIGFGLFVPLAQDRAASVGGEQYRGLTVLMWVTFVRIAQTIGPPAGSAMSVGLGPRVTFGLAAAGMMVAAVSWKAIRAWATGRAAFPDTQERRRKEPR